MTFKTELEIYDENNGGNKNTIVWKDAHKTRMYVMNAERNFIFFYGEQWKSQDQRESKSTEGGI